jgi:hypothetical protein
VRGFLEKDVGVDCWVLSFDWLNSLLSHPCSLLAPNLVTLKIMIEFEIDFNI